MSVQAFVNVLNELQGSVFESNGGDDAYKLVENTAAVREKIRAFGITEQEIKNAGDEDSFCLLALAFGKYPGQLVYDGQFRVWNGNSEDQGDAEFGTYAAHQPNYEGFKRLGKLDDYAYQSLVHMQNASHHLSWGLTVLDHANIPDELRGDVQMAVRESSSKFGALQEKLRAYVK